MSTPFNWRCPFCGRDVTITQPRYKWERFHFDLGSKYHKQTVEIEAVACPNDECREFSLVASLHDYRKVDGTWTVLDAKEAWNLVPKASVKNFPDYVPEAVLTDYREACLILNASPKASATLSRRCLQGMIRDFWKVSGRTLFDEIKAIEEKVDPDTWKAIDSVRSIGNIGAHMEKDINLIIDVDPEEANLLIGLIETLITEWYVARHERQRRMARIVAASDQKKEIKKVKALPAPASDAGAA